MLTAFGHTEIMVDNPVGLYLGENTLRIVESGLLGGQANITSIGVQRDAPYFYEIDTQKIVEDEAKIIEKLGSNLKIKKKNINVIIPDAVSFSQIIPMPQLKEKELLSAIKYQADQFIPLPIEEAALDLEVIFDDKVNKKLLVLMVAAPQKMMARVEKVVEASGFIPDSIENELSATGRFLSTFYKPRTPPDVGTLFINLGFSSTSFYFFHHQYQLILENHNFKLGLNLFLKEIQVNTRLDEQKSREALRSIGFAPKGSVELSSILKPVTQELVAETEKFMLAVKEKYKLAKIGQIYLLNFASDIHFLSEVLTQSLSIPTQLFNLAPYTVKNAQIGPYAADLSAFVSTIGGTMQS